MRLRSCHRCQEDELGLVTTEPISAVGLMTGESHPSCGGVVTFEGRVRNRHEGRKVKRLFYEAFIPMAEKVLQELMEEIKREWPDVSIKCRHRIGTLEIGEVAVAIVAWAPHRKEAFLACEAMINRIKQRVPIWKKEAYEDGKTQWVEACEAELVTL